MSSIDKLLIRGIRSFSPYQENIIEFYTPLTIIVGHNGAGKTTVIECLKYAACGDLPPNSKGGAFVHDPKLSREVEVKGQIKLKFKNVRGQTMVCTRSLQSTQKKTKLEQKTLESLLSTTDPTTGEPVSISSRCAEMDIEVPLQLGVSRAVLENVLFCHQEESFWPLSEPGVLKRKFDDIFAATRYTKALDTLKSLRKELSAELKLEQQKLDHLKGDREKAGRIRLEIDKNKAREQDAKNRVALIENQISIVNNTIERLTTEFQSLTTLQMELDRVMHDLSLTQQSRDDLSKGLWLMVEKNEELQTMLEDVTRQTTDREAKLVDLRDKRALTEREISDLNGRANAKSTEIGIMKAEIQRLRQKETILREHLSSIYEIFSITCDSTDLVAAISLISCMVLEQGHQLTDLNKSYAVRQAEFTQTIQQVSGRLSSIEGLKRIKEKLLAETQAKLATLIKQINEMAGARLQIEELTVQQMEDEGHLAEIQAIFNAANYEERLVVLGEKRREIEENLKVIGNQIAMATRSADARTRYDVKKADLERKKEHINAIYADLIEIHPQAGDILPEDCERVIGKLWKAKERERQSLQDQFDKASQEASIVQSKLEHVQAAQSQKSKELSDKSKCLGIICDEQDDFSTRIKELEEGIFEIHQELAIAVSSKDTYKAFQNTFSVNQCCPLCERSFDDKTNEVMFGQKLASLISNLPSQAIQLEAKQREIEAELSKMKQLRPIFDDMRRLRDVEIPLLDQEVKVCQYECEKALLTVEELKNDLVLIVADERKFAAMKKKAEELAKLIFDVKAMEEEMEALERTIGSSGPIIGMMDLQKQSSQYNEERTKIQDNVESLIAEQEMKRAEIAKQEQAILRIKERIMSLRLKQSDIIRLEESRKELEGQVEVLHNETVSNRQEIAQLEEELKRCTRERDSILSMELEKIKQLQELHDRAKSSLTKISSIYQEILSSQSDFTEERQSVLFGEREGLEKEIEENKKKLQGIIGRIDAHNKASSEVLILERNIRDNLRLREINKRISQLDEQIISLRTRLGGFDRLDLSDQLRKHKVKHSELVGERSGLFGELRQISNHTDSLQHELEADYQTIDEDYRGQFIKFNATLTAIEDLEKYAKALDQAIMKFHSYKMAEVNRIIKEIWTATYQGADIDTIEIRADEESATGAGGRSYDYRVVMCKGDTDLDMRGRSSAGQRVLASLIIRLALAETFGQHCGVIALDEPTTNLDRDNIESLAGSLAEIIKMRSAQGNFQLVIITHDEEFVELLGRHECADYYWRVFKDQQQYSTIERQSFQGTN